MSGASNGKTPKNRGLGRGLSALMSDVAADVSASTGTPEGPVTRPGMRTVATHRLARNPDQPRLRFDRDRLEELAESLRERGVLQPILVRPIPGRAEGTTSKNADYQIVAGERRYQAALIARIEQVPVIVRELDDRDVLEIGVIENVQRANLNPVEEARAYKRLADEFDRTHVDIAKAIGKSRAYVSNAIRLTGLPDIAQEHVLAGRLSAGHARAILSADDPKALTDAIVTRGLSVRDAERLAKPGPRGASKLAKAPDLVRMERELEDALGLKADLREGRGGAVTLKLGFRDAAQAEALVRKLLGS